MADKPYKSVVKPLWRTVNFFGQLCHNLDHSLAMKTFHQQESPENLEFSKAISNSLYDGLDDTYKSLICTRSAVSCLCNNFLC